MAYQVLARKWRPQQFQDMVGQEPLAAALQNSVIHERIGHAYLFTGTRGVGKTSLARLFAKSLRCENRLNDGNPCLKCNACVDVGKDSSFDVVEVDGASNNGVEHIRSLIENLQYLPAHGQYKIYIIDEVHMLSQSAFNALLKSLEEPPAHVIFIFATTDPEKLPSTVLSRCQRFDFRSIPASDLLAHVKKICTEEGIQYDAEELLEKIVAQGKGSARDTLSLLDQVLSFTVDNKITDEALSVALGLARTSTIADLCRHLFWGETVDVSKVYQTLIQENIEVKNICQALLDYLYQIIHTIDESSDVLVKEVAEKIPSAELFWIYEALAKDFSWALKSLSPENVIDIILRKVSLRRQFFSPESPNFQPLAEKKNLN